MMSNKISFILIIFTATGITLILAQPGLAESLFSSPVPPPSGGQAIWCADIEASFGPDPDRISFMASLTNTTVVTTPTTYPLNIPAGRLQLGVWQEQQRRQMNTGYLFPVPATEFGASSVISGTFPANSGPARYSLRLWDKQDGVWGRTDCEPVPAMVTPPAHQPPPPQLLTPAPGGWQTDYDPMTLTWQPPALAAGVPPVQDYQLQVSWENGATELITIPQTQTTLALPVAEDQALSWRLRARNSAGYGRWSEPARMTGIDATPPLLGPIEATQGVTSGGWQNRVSRPVFTWSGDDSGSGLAGYVMDWTPTWPCTPSVFTTTTGYSPIAAGGIHYLCLQAQDNAGNRSPTQTFEFRYDPPGVSLALTPDSLTAVPGEQAVISLTVTNQSLAAETVTLHGDLAGLPATLELAGSADHSRALTLTVPIDAANGALYLSPITATTLSGGSAMRSMMVQISRPDALEVLDPSDQTVRPGERLTYTLSLTNGAAVPVTFDLSAASAWPVTVPSSLTVPGLQQATFTASLPAPLSAAHETVNPMTLTATNRDYPAFSVQAALTATVTRVADRLTVTPSHQTTLPSQAINYTLSLTNGAGADDTFALSASSAWPVVLADSVTVSGGSSLEAPLTVLAPGGVLSGTVQTATLTAISQANSAVQLSAVITTVVGRGDRLQLTLLPPARVVTAAVDIPAVISATVWIQNNSNYADELAVSYALPPGWSGCLTGPPSFSLDPLAGRRATLEVTLPDAAASGAYRIPVTVTGRYRQQVVTFDVGLLRQASHSSLYLPVIIKNRASPAAGWRKSRGTTHE